MTTDLIKLSDAIQKDTPDKLIVERIRLQANEIRRALREGRNFELPIEGGKYVIRRKNA